MVIGVAIFYIPTGWAAGDHIFGSYNAHFKATPPGTASLLTAGQPVQYITLALGSAFAIFLYPHSVTGVLTTRNRAVVKRTLAALPIYSFVLGLIALFGVMAIAGKIKPLVGTNGKPNTNTVVPSLFQHMFPSWFAGLAFSMIVIGALVPAAFMSIAAANLFTRNIYKEYLRPQASPQEQAQVSKIVSLLVKAGALLFILLINPQFSIDLQLLGGAIILQTLPSVMIGLYTRWLHRGALIAGWAAGMIVSVWTFYLTPDVAAKEAHWGGTGVRAQPSRPAHRRPRSTSASSASSSTWSSRSASRWCSRRSGSPKAPTRPPPPTTSPTSPNRARGRHRGHLSPHPCPQGARDPSAPPATAVGRRRHRRRQRGARRRDHRAGARGRVLFWSARRRRCAAATPGTPATSAACTARRTRSTPGTYPFDELWQDLCGGRHRPGQREARRADRARSPRPCRSG